MTLIDEREVYYEQERKRKLFRNIVKAIVVLVVIAIVLLIFMKVKNYGKMTLIIDGKNVSSIPKTLVLKDDAGNNNGQIYLSVNDISNLLNRDYYNNEYKSKGEDKTKCQIKNGDEYTSLRADSKKIYKAIKKETNLNNNTDNESFQEIPETVVNFEYFEVEDAVKYVNDIMYANIDAIQLAFDVSVSYNSKKNILTISSLNYLENVAKSKRSDVADSSTYEYSNKRLLKHGMCIVNGSNGAVGIGSYTNSDRLQEYVASCKYSSLSYNEAANVIDAISMDGKHSVLRLNVNNQVIERTVTSDYDDIEVMDNEFKYFKVRSQNLYGIMDSSGNLILASEFNDIGIDDSKYTDVSSKYILNGKYVPIKQNGLWGLCDLQGNILITPRFQGIGCSVAKNGESVVVIPQAKGDSDGIVFLYNKDKALYGLYSANNGDKIAVSLVEVFKKDESGISNYYINHVIDVNNPVIHTLNVYKDL